MQLTFAAFGEKTCKNGHILDAASVYTSPRGTTYCRTCRRKWEKDDYAKDSRNKIEASRKWRSSERGIQTIRKTRRKRRLRRYGLTEPTFAAMAEKQLGLCAICLSAFRLVVDHSHSTGKVRGLLCRNCNRALGLFRENVQALNRAIEYLAVSRG